MSKVRKYKILGVIIMTTIGLTLSGCVLDKSNKSNKKDYKEYALETLEKRYGEEFEIKQVGGTFAAYKDTKKLICNPISDKDQFIFVEVERDLSEVYDDYINKIMSDKLLANISEKAKEVYGENINIKLKIGGSYNKYTSIDMDVADFLKINSIEPYMMDIFIKSHGQINKDIEGEKLDRFTKYLLSGDIKNDSIIVPWYIGESEYNKVDSMYNKLDFENKMYDYYRASDELYSEGYSTIEKQKQTYNLQEIINEFESYN